MARVALMIVSFSRTFACSVWALFFVLGAHASPAHMNPRDNIPEGSDAAANPGGPTTQPQKTDCQNYMVDFSQAPSGWIPENSEQDTYEFTSDGLKMNLVPPAQYVRMRDARDLPYNQYEGRGPTFNASTYMHYGRFSATVKSSSVGGAITAVILIADSGDEIDIEFLGGDPDHVQSNFFWGHRILYTVNGEYHQVPGQPVFNDFHTYDIDWSPERIIWSIDGTPVRVKERKDTCDETGVCKYPSDPARVQIGLWDGSIESGTAQWSRGPIDWSQHSVISAYVKNIIVECNPEYNNIIN